MGRKVCLGLTSVLRCGGVHPLLELQGGCFFVASRVRGCTPRWGILPFQGGLFCGAARVGLHPALGYFAPTGQVVLRGRSREGLHPALGYFAPTGRVVLRGRSRGAAPPVGVFCPSGAGYFSGPLARGYTPHSNPAMRISSG